MQPEKARQITAISFWVLIFIASALELVWPAPPSLAFAEMFVFTGLIFAWVHFDAKVRDFRVGPLFRVGVVALAAVFVPIYLIRSRGALAGFKSLGIILGLSIAVIALTIAVEYFVPAAGNIVG